jgi:hypothetical protein
MMNQILAWSAPHAPFRVTDGNRIDHADKHPE